MNGREEIKLNKKLDVDLNMPALADWFQCEHMISRPASSFDWLIVGEYSDHESGFNIAE